MINYLFKEQNWQSQMSDLITDPFELLSILKLSTQQLNSQALLANEQFKLRVPRQFVNKIQPEQPLDPILLQIFPHHLEMQQHQGFSLDPLGEKDANALSGVLHKYKSRLLMTLTDVTSPIKRICPKKKIGYLSKSIS